jgi:hypothetical protein
MLAIVVQVNPNIGGNLRLFRKSNHVDSWRVAGRPAGPALERSFQLPDRRRRWAAYGVQRHAGARLAAAAHYLQPAITGIKALCDCRRGLRRTAEALHLRRPQQAFGSVRLAGRLLGPFAGALQADPGAPDAIAKNAKSTAASHVPISSALGPFRNTPAIGVVTCAAPIALPERVCRCPPGLRRLAHKPKPMGGTSDNIAGTRLLQRMEPRARYAPPQWTWDFSSRTTDWLG